MQIVQWNWGINAYLLVTGCHSKADVKWRNTTHCSTVAMLYIIQNIWIKHYDALEYLDFMQSAMQCSAMYIWYDMDILKLDRIQFYGIHYDPKTTKKWSNTITIWCSLDIWNWSKTWSTYTHFNHASIHGQRAAQKHALHSTHIAMIHRKDCIIRERK